jgi:trans-aconitate methyltransferase
VFRNPVIPDLNEVHYLAPHHWGGAEDHRRFEERLEFVAENISRQVKLRAGNLIVDIGGGPGWLAKKLTLLFPHARVVLCEPAIENAKFAKSQTAMSRLMLKSAKRALLIENLRSLRGLGKMRVR